MSTMQSQGTGGYVRYKSCGSSLVHPVSGHRLHAKTDGAGRRLLVSQGEGTWSMVLLDERGAIVGSSVGPTQRVAWDALQGRASS